jgi:hypothetical protein
MRTRRSAVCPLFVCLMACVTCGGSESNSSGAKSAQASASAEPGARPTSTSSEEPTTTTALGDAGEGSGTKLVESQPPAANTASAASAPSASVGATEHGAHSHEPGRSVADIRAIIVAHRDEARACYDKALADHPGIEGDLVIDWTIDPKGNVSRISLDTARSQISEPSVGACVIGIIKKIQFNSSPGGYETRASYPFNFHPRHTSPTPAP